MEIRQQSDTQRCAWLKLISDKNWSLMQKHQLLKTFECPTKVYQHSVEELANAIQGRPQKKQGRTQTVSKVGSKVASMDKMLLWLEQPQHYLIGYNDAYYPELLREIADPPIALFAKGDLNCLQDPKIAIVGSRRPTNSGEVVCQQLAQQLSELGVVVVSGMALGIDGYAHRAALSAQQATIAIMGCGLDIISPARHRDLYDKIAERGCLLSEYPLGYPASKFTFPQRNRIVSGLSYGAVIIEAAARSGTLITARLAMEQGRDVFVVPGSALSSQYAGSHQLIRDGASLISKTEHILEALSVELQSALAAQEQRVLDSDEVGNCPETKAERALLPFIAFESTSINVIMHASGLTIGQVSSMLLALELDGLIVKTHRGGYLRVR